MPSVAFNLLNCDCLEILAELCVCAWCHCDGSAFNYGWIAIFEAVILIFLFRLKKVKRRKIFQNQIKLNDAIHQVLI